MAINRKQMQHRQINGKPSRLQKRRHHTIRKRIKTYWFVFFAVIVVGVGYWLGNNYMLLENQAIARQSQGLAKKKKVKSVSEMKKAIANQAVAKPDYSGTSQNLSPDEIRKLADSPLVESLRAYVQVPSYGINEPVYEGTSAHVLAIGVGIFEPNVTFGQGYISVFGHNMGDSQAWPTKFSAMQNMTKASVVGQKILASDGKKQYTYKITNFQSGVPVQMLNQQVAAHEQAHLSKPMIQLVACDEDADFQAHLRATNYTDFTCNKRLVLTGILE